MALLFPQTTSGIIFLFKKGGIECQSKSGGVKTQWTGQQIEFLLPQSYKEDGY